MRNEEIGIEGDGHRFGHWPDLSGAQMKFSLISRLLRLRT